MQHRFAGTERYRIVRQLGEGGMGVVYEVEDQERGERVALKTLKHYDPEKLYRLKREFRVLAELSDPHLVALLELEVTARTCFFTMELVHGSSLLSYIRADGLRSDGGGESTASWDSSQSSLSLTPSSSHRYTPTPGAAGADGFEWALSRRWPCCDEQRLRRALPQLARGLNRLHEAGTVHRDIKPSNILVTHQERLVLLDFGLVAEVEDPVGTDDHIVGTAAYMAPEQCRGEPPTAAADWYAVGVVLYEALTHEQPFHGPLKTMMKEKQRSPPIPPQALVPGVPLDLENLCMDLLALDPGQRPNGAAVLERLGTHDPERSAHAVQSRQSSFSGRQDELLELSRGLQLSARDRPLATLVSGPSGIGKSTLVHHFLAQARDRTKDLVILQGRCYDRETVPFQALDSLIDSLSRHWRRLPADAAAALLPQHAAMLQRLFPVLGRVPAIAGAPRVRTVGEPQEMRHRAVSALRETLRRLGQRSSLVLFLDDMQWADRGTLGLLADLMRAPDPPRLLLILAGRPESQAALARLIKRMDVTSSVLELEPLPWAAALQLARSLLGDHAPELADHVASEAGGNPFFVCELARWLLGATSHAAVEPIALDGVLRDRINALSEDARRVLEIVTLAGAHLSRRCLRQAIGLHRAAIARELGSLTAAKLVRFAGGSRGDRIEPFHDRIRDVVLTSLSESSRSSHHRALAVALEGKASAEQLAFHWRGAGDHQRAAEHALGAAEEALARLDFERGAALYQMALGLGCHEPAARCALTTALAEALTNAGRPAEAARAFREAAELAGAAPRLELMRRSAEALLRGGYLEEGLGEMQKVLGTIGLSLASSPQRALLSLIWHRALVRLRGWRWKPRSAGDLAPRTLTRVDVCWSVTAGLGFVDPIRGADYQARHLLMALDTGEPMRIGRSLAVETSYLAAQGSQRARQADVISRRLASDTDDPYLRALTCLGAAFIDYYLDNRWRAALGKLADAERLLRPQGRCWELDTAQLWTCFSQIYLGELAELAHQVPAKARAAELRGDLFMAVNLRTRANFIWLVADDPEGAQRELENAMQAWMHARDSFQLQHLFALWAGCEISLYSGQPAAAAEQMAQQIGALRRSKLLHVEMVRLEVLTLQTRIALAQASLLGPRERRPLLDEARRHIRRLGRIRLPLAQALTPVFCAGAANLAGRAAACEAHLRHATCSLDRLETMLWAHAARRRLGEVVGGQEGAALSNQAASWMGDQGIVNRERLTTLLIPGW